VVATFPFPLVSTVRTWAEPVTAPRSAASAHAPAMRTKTLFPCWFAVDSAVVD